MPKALPREFREDVIRVFRESGSSITQVARDFGISESCLSRWLAEDNEQRSGRAGSATGAGEPEELREARKRIRLLEQENEVLRRAAAYLSQAHLPGK
jgi:transposase